MTLFETGSSLRYSKLTSLDFRGLSPPSFCRYTKGKYPLRYYKRKMNRKFRWYNFADPRFLRGEAARIEKEAQGMGLTGQSSPLPGRTNSIPKASPTSGGGGAKRCEKGKACKATCIHKLDECLEEFPESINDSIRSISRLLAEQVESGRITEEKAEEVASTFKGLDKGQLKAFENYEKLIDSGKATDSEKDAVARLLVSTIVTPGQDRNAPRVLSFDDIESILKPGKLDELEKAYQNSFSADGKFDPSQKGGMGNLIRQKHLVNEISDEVASAAYGMLPSKVRSAIDKAGAVKGEGVMYAGDDKEGNPTFSSDPTRARGLFLVKRWMEQGGIDPYTGKPIDIRNAEPEHMVAFAHALAKGGGGDQPRNLLWSAAAPNNQKAGAGDNFLQWKKTLENYKAMGREEYEKMVFNPAIEGATARKGKKEQAPTALAQALNSMSIEERVAGVRKLIDSYGKEVRYLIRAGGIGWQHQDRDLDHRMGGKPAFMDNGVPRVPGMKVKPSTAVLVALAAVDPSRKPELMSRLEELRKSRILSDSEAERVRGNNSARLALQAQKSKEYGDALATTLTKYVSNLGMLLQ